MRAKLGRDAAGEPQVADIARHVFSHRRYRKHGNAILFTFVHEFGQTDERLLFEFRSYEDRKRHGRNVETNTIIDRNRDVFVGKLLEDTCPSGDSKNYRLVGFRIDGRPEHATRQHNRIRVGQKRFNGFSRLF